MKNEYYSLKKINKLNALYNLIIGQRSNGKTYAVCEQEIKGYFKEGFKLEGVKKVAKRVKGGVIIDTTDFTIKVN